MNPDFAAGLQGWTTHGSTGWTGGEGHAAPGSARCSHTRQGNTSTPACLSQCVAASANTAYDFGGFIKLVSVPHATAQGSIFLIWFDNPTCSGFPPLGSVESSRSSATTWQAVGAAHVTAPPGTKAAAIVANLGIEVSGSFDAFWDDLYFEPSCSNSSTTLCVADSRFEVEASWQTPDGQSGAAHPVPLSSDSGYFWFFHPANSELFVKVKNACVPPFNRFWVFAAGLTNVKVELKVTDTRTGESKIYQNPLNRPFPPIQDTDAFATCP